MHGVEEMDGENTDDMVLKIINERLELRMVLENIQRSHRLGPRNASRNTRQKPNKATCDNLSLQGLSCKTIGVLQKEKVTGYRYFYNRKILYKKRYTLYKHAVAKYGIGKNMDD